MKNAVKMLRELLKQKLCGQQPLCGIWSKFS